MNPLRLKKKIRETASVQVRVRGGDVDVRQATIIGHIEKLDKFILGLLGERRAIRVARPRVQAFLGEICIFRWRKQRKPMCLARHRRWARRTIFRENVFETRFQLERCEPRASSATSSTTPNHRPPFVISRHRRRGAGHLAGRFVCLVGTMARASLGGETERVSRCWSSWRAS